jgi:DNA-binding MurR/RpiR family transcriptional regulator
MDFQSKLTKEIKNKYSQLTHNQQMVAEYLLENYSEVAFLNIKEFSEILGISVASIVRFSQEFGYDGYSQLREKISKSLKDHFKSQDLLTGLKTNNGEANVLLKVANHDIKNINQTLNQISPEVFDSIVKIMMKADSVYVGGIGISNLLSRIMAYEFSQVGLKAQALNAELVSFKEQLLLLDSNDLLIVISFPPYSSQTIEALKYARKHNITTVAITNHLTSPTGLLADHVLAIESKNYLRTNSISAMSVVINALTTEYARKNIKVAEKYIKKLKQLNRE